MHELAVTQNILDIALRHAQEADADQITALHIVIGRLSSFVDDSVQFYWDIISKDTIAKGARLYFTRLPAVFECRRCRARFPLEGEDFTCPLCGAFDMEVISGDEFYLEAIDVETSEVRT